MTSSPRGTAAEHQADASVSLLPPDRRSTGRAPVLDEFVPTARDTEREISIVQDLTLSPTLQRWVNEYARLGERPEYLWKWCRLGVEVTTLPCTRRDMRDHLYDTKVLGVMLDVLLDDVADQQGDARFLELLLGIPYRSGGRIKTHLSSGEREYADFTVAVWDEIHRRVRTYPLYARYADLLRFDYLQLFNVMRYSHLLNENLYLLNLSEHDLYSPHNMHMMVSSTIDLMCSPNFDQSELGKLREAVWRAQCMGRIGNMVTTWQRELGEGDFTSGIFARAVSKNSLSVEDLKANQRERIEATIRQAGHEEHFLSRWQRLRRELLLMQPLLTSVDLAELIGGLERLICLHLGSRGAK